jgi:hypothetical protein
MSDDDLTWAVEASAAQGALLWMVHQWECDEPNKSLDIQISRLDHNVGRAGDEIMRLQQPINRCL